MRSAIVIAANGPPQSPDRLRFAETDGDKIASILQERRANFEVIRIPADMPAVEARGIIFERAESCRPEDTFLTYFSGHGRARKGNLLLQLNGSSVDKPLTTHLVAADLLMAFQNCLARSRVLILDCCNAGGVAREVGMKSGGTEVKALGIESDTFDILMASGFLEAAFEVESLGGGFLTHGILEALGDKFVEADADQDRAISFLDLTKWLEKQADLANASRSTMQRIPRPARLGYGTGMSYLTRPPDESIIHEFNLPNTTRTVLLPVYPQRVRELEFVISMGAHPVTNAQYRKYVEATGASEPVGKTYSADKGWHGEFRPWREQSFCADDQPVVCVDALNAVSYCKWLAKQCDPRIVKGILLPQESLWNVAAFRRRYWSYPPRDVQSRFREMCTSPAACLDVPERTSKLGFTDLFGNVWEWGGTISEWKNFYDYGPGWLSHAIRPRIRNILRATPPPTNERQVRGGSFFDDLSNLEGHIRTDDLAEGEETKHTDLGFRVAVIHDTTAIEPEVLTKLFEYYALVK